MPQMDDPPVPRLLQSALQAAMADTPVVCPLGPRQCGKSILVEHQVPVDCVITRGTKVWSVEVKAA